MKSFGQFWGKRVLGQENEEVKLRASSWTIECHATGTNYREAGATLHKVRSRFQSFTNCTTPLEIALLDRLLLRMPGMPLIGRVPAISFVLYSPTRTSCQSNFFGTKVAYKVGCKILLNGFSTAFDPTTSISHMFRVDNTRLCKC